MKKIPILDNYIPMEDYFAQAEKSYDDFDEKAWSKGSGYFSPNFEFFNKNLEGLEEGLYMFAGEANSGKSALMMNLLYDYCTYSKNKLFGLIYSLDDSKQDIIARVIAMNNLIPISVASKPQRFQSILDGLDESIDTEYRYSKIAEMLDKRKEGLNNLKKLSNKFMILDSEEITSIEDLLMHAKNVKVHVKTEIEGGNIIIGIDSLADLNFKKQKFKSDKDKNDCVAQTVKGWAKTELKVPIFGSLHLRKLNQNRRPTLDDVKESGRYAYEASTLFLIHNDINKNKQSSQIYWREKEESDFKLPILELDWAKNKKSSFKGHSFFRFQPDYSHVTECSREEAQRYLALMYTN